MATMDSLQKEARKEISRLKKAARRVEKRGYKFNLPFDTEKEYTKEEVESLKSKKTKDLYQYSTHDGMSGERYRELERKRAAQKGVQTKIEKGIYKKYYKSISKTIIDNFLNRPNWIFLKDKTYDKLESYIRGKIDEIGENAVAEAIQRASADGFVKEFQVAYDYKFLIKLAEFDTYFDGIEEELGEEYEEPDEEWEDIEEEDFDEIFG